MIDGHIHLSLFPEDKLDAYLKEAADLGITRFLQGGYEPKDWVKQSELKAKLGGNRLVTCFGLHPWHVVDSSKLQLDLDFALLEKEITKADMIGEVGIDRFYKRDDIESRDKQVQYFHRQLELADKIGKPIVFHIVRAYGEALDYLKDKKREYAGLMHSYAGSSDSAREYRKLGLFISVGPGLLHKGFHKLKQTVQMLDVQDFIIESDAPHAGHPDEGQNLNASLVFDIGRALAEMKGTSIEKVLESSNRNILSLLKN